MVITALLIIFLLPLKPQAQEHIQILNEQQDHYSIGHQLTLYEDTSAAMSIDNIVNASTIFSPSQSAMTNFGFTDSAIWARFQLRNDSPRYEWWLEVGHSRLENLTLYQLTPQGWQEQNSGTTKLSDEQPLNIRSNLLPIVIAPGESLTFYLRVQSRTALSLAVSLWRPSAFTTFIELYSFLNGANFAMMMSLILYSLLIWLLLRKALYLQFALFSFSVTLFWSSMGGYFHQYIGLLPQGESIRIIIFSFSFFNLCYLIFARNFLQSQHYAPLWDQFLKLLVGITMLEMGLSIWSNFSIIAQLILLVALLSSLIIFLVAIIIIFKGYKPARQFIMIQAILFPFVIIKSLSVVSILPSITGQILTVIGISILMLLLMMSSNRQMKLLANEKKAALTQALKIEHSMVQELESQVIERTHKLKMAQTQAEQANIAKGEFLAVMSHELRTPMTAILGAAQLIDTTRLSQQNQHLFNSLNHASNQLITLIDDVLDLAKMDVGQLKLKNYTFSPQHVLLDAITLLQPAAEKRGLILKLATEILPKQVQGDAVRLGQIITNLINNAIKYTDHGSITVRAELLEPADGILPIYISVQDTGCGIPEKMQSRIFQSFEQVNSSSASEQGSAGLGLAICKRLVNEMNGTIGVESEAGQGSLFWFTVDLLPANTQTSVSQAHFKSLEPLHILLAEDIDMNREIITLLLRRDGHQVTSVASGQEVVDLVSTEEPFDLVLMDIQMTGMNGLQASALIRQQPDQTRAGIPILALTASSTPQMNDRCRTAGMNALVSKPLCLQKLYTTLAACTNIPMSHYLEPIDKQQMLNPLDSLTDEEYKKITVIRQQTLTEEGTRLTTAWACQDLTTLATAAHKIAGCAAMTGLTKLSKISLQLEEAARTADIERLYTLMDLYRKHRTN